MPLCWCLHLFRSRWASACKSFHGSPCPEVLRGSPGVFCRWACCCSPWVVSRWVGPRPGYTGTNLVCRYRNVGPEPELSGVGLVLASVVTALTAGYVSADLHPGFLGSNLAAVPWQLYQCVGVALLWGWAGSLVSWELAQSWGHRG